MCYSYRIKYDTRRFSSLSETEIKTRIKDLLSDYKPLLEAEEAVFTEGSD